MIALLCLFITQNATAFCRKVRPYVSVETKMGYVRYITHLSRDEFLRRAPTKMSPSTLGMTVSKLGLTGFAEPEIQQQGPDTACVQIRRINLMLGYDTLDVYIDKRYKPGSCEYEVVKKHENYHVRVSQEAMAFFRPDIDAALDKALSHIEPATVHSQAELQNAFEHQFQQVMHELQPLIDHINQKIAEKNYIIDTPESYAETTALCRNW